MKVTSIENSASADGGPRQGCTKFFLAGNQPYLNLNWLRDFVHIILCKISNNSLLFIISFIFIVNNDYVLLNNKDNRNKPVATMKAVLSLNVPALSVVSLAGYL